MKKKNKNIDKHINRRIIKTGSKFQLRKKKEKKKRSKQ